MVLYWKTSIWQLIPLFSLIIEDRKYLITQKPKILCEQWLYSLQLGSWAQTRIKGEIFGAFSIVGLPNLYSWGLNFMHPCILHYRAAVWFAAQTCSMTAYFWCWFHGFIEGLTTVRPWCWFQLSVRYICLYVLNIFKLSRHHNCTYMR